MALFENYEDVQDVQNEDKNRLFETQKRAERSIHDYLKVLGPVVLAVIVIGGAVVYFTMPGVGDEVRPPQTLDDAVKTYFLDQEKREVTEATYFKCKDSYGARVVLEKRADVTARQYDHGNRRLTAVEGPNDSWQISSAIIAPNETFDPCIR